MGGGGKIVTTPTTKLQSEDQRRLYAFRKSGFGTCKDLGHLGDICKARYSRDRQGHGKRCGMQVLDIKNSGGEGGIRTLGTGISQYNGLANRRIRPLCHLSVF